MSQLNYCFAFLNYNIRCGYSKELYFNKMVIVNTQYIVRQMYMKIPVIYAQHVFVTKPMKINDLKSLSPT